MVPGVGKEGDALHGTRLAGDEAKQEFLDRDDGDQNVQGESPRRFPVLEQFQGRPEHDGGGSEQQHDRDRSRRQRFGFAVAVGMLRVGWRRRHDEPAPHNNGTDDVRHRFHRIGREGVGMSEEAGGKFRPGQDGVRGHAQENDPQTAFQSVRWHAELEQRAAKTQP